MELEVRRWENSRESGGKEKGFYGRKTNWVLEIIFFHKKKMLTKCEDEREWGWWKKLQEKYQKSSPTMKKWRCTEMRMNNYWKSRKRIRKITKKKKRSEERTWKGLGESMEFMRESHYCSAHCAAASRERERERGNKHKGSSGIPIFIWIHEDVFVVSKLVGVFSVI